MKKSNEDRSGGFSECRPRSVPATFVAVPGVLNANPIWQPKSARRPAKLSPCPPNNSAGKITSNSSCLLVPDPSHKKVNGDLTQILQAVNERIASADELLPLVYDELRSLAASRMARESNTQTLQATALVHEAWLRLVKENSSIWNSRGHFFAAAAEAMRRILIERARRKMSKKRGGGLERINVQEVEIADTIPDERILLIDEALQALKAKDEELAQIVMLKFYGGLTNDEVGDLIGVTERTVRTRWAFARAWLMERIRKQSKGDV